MTESTEVGEEFDGLRTYAWQILNSKCAMLVRSMGCFAEFNTNTDKVVTLTAEKNSRAWLIVATFFQENSFIKSILAEFSFWSGSARRKKRGNRFRLDKIGEDDPYENYKIFLKSY